jgi:hypothetical protein
MSPESKRYYRMFRRYTSWAFKSLDGLLRSVMLYHSFQSIDAALDACKIDTEIINDYDKLKMYLELMAEQNKGGALGFGTIVQEVTTAKLKPQYDEYIKRYGIPNGWVFDSKKMAIVIKDLIEVGIMPAPLPPSDGVCTTSGLGSNSSDVTSASNTSNNEEGDITATATDTATATATDTAT